MYRKEARPPLPFAGSGFEFTPHCRVRRFFSSCTTTAARNRFTRRSSEAPYIEPSASWVLHEFAAVRPPQDQPAKVVRNRLLRSTQPGRRPVDRPGPISTEFPLFLRPPGPRVA